MSEWRETSTRTGGDARGLPNEIPLPWLLATLFHQRRTLAIAAGAGLGLALVAALLKPTYYTSTFSFLPQTQDQARGGLASIAGQFGIPIGMLGGSSQPPQLYADLLKTAEVLAPISRDTLDLRSQQRRVPVPEFFGTEGSSALVTEEETMRVLREAVISSSVASRTTGTVTVKTRTKSPEASLQIAERLLAGLNDYNRVTRQSQAAEERRFTQARLEAAQLSLRTAEDALQSFLQRNRQFSSPQLTFEQDRLQRAVTLQQQVVNGLAQQYEDARIREVRDTPVITVVEKPRLPVMPDPRGRIRLLLLGLIFGSATGLAIVLGREGWRRQQTLAERDPMYALPATEVRRVREKSSVS